MALEHAAGDRRGWGNDLRSTRVFSQKPNGSKSPTGAFLHEQKEQVVLSLQQTKHLRVLRPACFCDSRAEEKQTFEVFRVSKP